MNCPETTSTPTSIQLGASLPLLKEVEDAQHLFVSLSELVLEGIFYHPALEMKRLETVETLSLNGILGDQTLANHFVTSLVARIRQELKPNYQNIRVALGGDSHYRALLGGNTEPEVQNPQLGYLGVSRYQSEFYRQAFVLECEVIKQLRHQDHNVEIVVPYVRTQSEAASIIDLLAEQGLVRGQASLKIWCGVDVPASALCIEKLLKYFDGAVLHLENLTQHTLGVDKREEGLSALFHPEHESVLELVQRVLSQCHNSGKPILILSQNLKNHKRLHTLTANYSAVQGVEI